MNKLKLKPSTADDIEALVAYAMNTLPEDGRSHYEVMVSRAMERVEAYLATYRGV